MKKLTFVLLAGLLALTACDNDTTNQAMDDDVSPAVEQPTEAAATAEESLRTPADLSEEDSAEMYKIIFDYNKCMMASRLNATQDHKSMQNSANEILQSCESHLTHLEDHLNSQNLNKALVIGMVHKMRSKAARKLMAQGMNQMAAQAMAAESADKMKAAE